MRLWTIGRQREKQHVAPHFKDAAQRKLLFDVIDAIHDLKEAERNPQFFVSAARTALLEGNGGVVQQTSGWLAKVACRLPAVAILWEELAIHRSWKIRWDVACRLYWNIAEDQSDRLFSLLRHDRSKKVREIAIHRYEWRTNSENTFVRMYDANEFYDRVRRGEARLYSPLSEIGS